MIALRRSEPDSAPAAGSRCLNPSWMTQQQARTAIPLALAALALLAFGGTLAAPFHYDDFSLFVDPVITAPSGWYEVWAPDRTRPLTQFTFWLNYALGGENAAGYHAFNLILHAIAVFLLHGALRRLIPSWAALIAAVLFALHPIQTEPVAYIYARGALLMTVLCLASLRAWLRDRRWTAVIWFALALLAKEECAAFPLFLVLLNLSQGRERKDFVPIGAMITLALAAGVRVIFVLAQIPESGAGAGSGVSVVDYLLAQGTVLWRYLRLLVVPWGFTIDSEIPVPPVWLALCAWAGILLLAILASRRFRQAEPGFWLLAGLILLAPSSSVFPADDLAVDRRLYLPLIAFAPTAGLLLCRLRARWLTVAGVCLLALTLGRVYVWQSPERLWAEAVSRSPGKVRPRIQLARVADDSRAIGLLREAQSIAPDDPAAASELGRRFLQMNRPAEALREFGRALASAPNDPLAYNNRGVALMQLNQRSVAIDDFRRALALDPCQFDAHFNLMQLGVKTVPPAGCHFTPEQRDLLSVSH